MKNLFATKIEDYVLEPLFDAASAQWQSHHVTNPTAFRPSFDERVYLGYRAGGDRDHYCINDADVYSSSLGLAILDESGEKVLFRFPYPIMKIKRKTSLPQSSEEYNEYIKTAAEDICVLHDFRFYEHEDNIYLIYHDGQIMKAFDCIKRINCKTFYDKVNSSIKLIEENDITKDKWESIWNDDIWTNAGVDGTRLFYPTDVTKNDIVFIELHDKSLQISHRPLPDIAVVDAECCVHGVAGQDGITDFGTLERCVRPGFFDNSHIGVNGAPTKAKIGEVDVYIDIVHGVNNRTFSKTGDFRLDMMTYMPFLRVKDAQNGKLLYYSENPIVSDDEIWQEYSVRGRWVQGLPLHCIIFAGGQIEKCKGKNNLDDVFYFYTGLGDTAIARAKFTLRQLIPENVIEDIIARNQHTEVKIDVKHNSFKVDKNCSGWEWEIKNNIQEKSISITRKLSKNGVFDIAEKTINKAPGYFDADLLFFDGTSVKYYDNLGFCMLYTGCRFIEGNGIKMTQVGTGIIVFDKNNLERILFRSTEPLQTSIRVYENWNFNSEEVSNQEYVDSMVDYIPENVKYEIERMYYLIGKGQHWESDHTKWLRKRAEM